MSINIVLYQPEIPPNTGNVARTCALTGTKLHLIRPLGFSIDSKAVKRAGLDYWHLLDLEIHDSLDEFLNKYGNEKIFLATTKGAVNYSEVEYPNECFIIFGRETGGIPDSLHNRYKKTRIIIPMLNNVDVRSLNLSNSVAIVLYEALRQKKFKQLL